MFSDKYNQAIFNWLMVVCGLIIFMVVFGGTVRLTRSGLSIVEWRPISGVVPPIGQEAWQAEFAKYQQSPEFQYINQEMTLAGFKRIFYLEYVHRLIARFAGLVVAIPLLYFLWKQIIPRRKSPLYVAIGLLFGLQGFLGWYMVSSGLEDRPAVSHYRLTLHLILALTLLALAFWAALNHHYGFPPRFRQAVKSHSFLLSATLIGCLVIQIIYGGFMAGLKAGHISNTYPLMAGRLVPLGMLSYQEPWWLNLLSTPTTVHFIHRWFAIVVLLAAIALYYHARKQPEATSLKRGIGWMVGLTVCQITLGVSVIWFNVPIILALAHQALALFLFLVILFINYHLLHQVSSQSATTAVKAGQQPEPIY